MTDDIVIPDKPAFKAAEVCDLLKVPPYVLKSWENEFKDLGVSKTASGPRVYRREDVARAVRIRHLVLHEGLTLAGVRRRIEEESGAPSAEDALVAEIAAAARPPVTQEVPAAAAASPEATASVAARWRQRTEQLRDGLRELFDVLSRPIPASPVGTGGETFVAEALAGAVPPVERARNRHQGQDRGTRSSAPVRDLVVEPEPAELSLFAESEGDVAPEAVPRAVPSRDRRAASGRGASR